MGRSVLALCLVSSLAFAQDVPRRMYQVAPTTQAILQHPDWVLTDEGKQRLDATLARHVRELEQLRAENASMRADLVTWQSKPALTWKGALLLVGVGVVVGAAVAIPLAVRR